MKLISLDTAAGNAAKCAMLFLTFVLLAQPVPAAPPAGGKEDRTPGKVRNYKVEQAKIKVKAPKGGGTSTGNLISLGEARVVGVGPLRVTLEVPLTVAPVDHSGRVELLVFEDVTVNGTPVTVEDYTRAFELPKDAPLTLPEPLRIHIGSASAVLSTVTDILDPRETWEVKGRVYVCGRYKRFFLSFRRAVPLMFTASIANPL